MQSTDDSLPPAGPSFRDALDRLVNAFDAHQIRYAIIGSRRSTRGRSSRGTAPRRPAEVTTKRLTP